jgi:collagen type III alpha
MPTATTSPRPIRLKAENIVDQSIDRAAARVRWNDLATGAAILIVTFLSYIVLMMSLDKWLVIPAVVRQFAFIGFLALCSTVLYFGVIRPYRRRVNPRYIARQVEQTIPDAKNVLINWVDLQDAEMPGTVKTAVAQKAADGLGHANLESATHSSRLMWFTIVAGVLLASLAALFILFKWPQFSSLVSRAINPFTNTEIASRTRIDLLEPIAGHATITDGEQLNISISIGGSVPDPNGPEKPRILVRRNPDATTYEDFPLIRGESSREFALMLPRSIIQNGFWYKVAAGDSTTDEFRVDVRTRPMLTGFDVKYEYPTYLKWPADFGVDARLKGMRGTTVTLTVQTNRSVDSGSLIVTAGKQNELIRGEVTGANQQSLRFQLKLVESGIYFVQFKPNGGESTFTSTQYPIEVEIDQAPIVRIVSPREEEIALPVTSMLAIDAVLNDDHGIVSAGLRMKLPGQNSVVIPTKKFRDGKSLARTKDGSFETEIPDYKESVTLDKLTDEAGKPIVLKEGDLLEYWVEATDNCTEPTANSGESVHQRVRIASVPPKPDPAEEQRTQKRKAEENTAQKQQEQRQQNDTRPQDQARNPDQSKQAEPSRGNEQANEPKKGEDKKGENEKSKGENKQAENPSSDGKGKTEDQPANTKKESTKPDSPEAKEKQGSGNTSGQDSKTEKPSGTSNPEQKQEQKPEQPSKGQQSAEGSKDAKPEPSKQSEQQNPEGSGQKSSDQKLEKEANQIKKRMEQRKEEPADAKGNKPAQNDESKPSTDDNNKPAQGKPESTEKKPGETQDGKPADKSGKKSGEKTAGDQQEPGPKNQPDASSEKEAPKDSNAQDQPGTAEQKQGPKEGTEGAGSSKTSKPETAPDSKDSKDPKNSEKPGSKGDQKSTDATKPDSSSQPEKSGSTGNKQKESRPENKNDKQDKQPKEPADSSSKSAADEKTQAKESHGTSPAEEKPRTDANQKPSAEKSGTPSDSTTPKDQPKTDSTQPMKSEGEPGANKPEGAKPETAPNSKTEERGSAKPSKPEEGSTGKADKVEKAEDRNDDKANKGSQTEPKSQGEGDQKPSQKEIDQAVRELEHENPGTREAAKEKPGDRGAPQPRDEIGRPRKTRKSEARTG